VIPVFSYLKKHGASKGATTSFLISTPQTGVDSIMITYSLLGPIFAIFRPLVAFFSGIVGGLLVSIFDKEDAINNLENECDTDCCEEEKGTLYKIFNYGFVKLPEDIGSVLVFGIVAAALISMLIPENFFIDIGGGFIGMLLMLIIGLPSYICATASVPLALALHLKGFSMGALIVFLMTGPATNIATISVSIKQIGKKATAIYISSIIVCSIISGLVFDMIFPGLTIENAMSHVHHMSSNFELLSAILLILILLNVFRIKFFNTSKTSSEISKEENLSNKLSLKITGMTCNHCVEMVKKTVNEIKGCTVKSIDLKSGLLDILLEPNTANHSEIKKKIIELSYKVEDV
tara:strand:- start:283 stop:1326 length:1044 start_codon:yes stop_codon:yes gene_type:complete